MAEVLLLVAWLCAGTIIIRWGLSEAGFVQIVLHQTYHSQDAVRATDYISSGDCLLCWFQNHHGLPELIIKYQH